MRVALAAVAALLSLNTKTTGASAEGVACTTCAVEAGRTRLDSLLSDDPARGRIDGRLDDKPWIASDWATLPVVVKPADQSLDVTTSLQHVGSYEARRNAKKIEEAKVLAPKGLAVPKAAPARPAALDVWSKVEVKELAGTGRDETRGTVGADYKVTRRALVGISAEARDETATLTSDTRLAAYFAIKPWSPVTLDAKAQWGESTLGVPGLGATQSAVSARLKGNFSYEGLRLSPVVSVAHGVDEGDLGGSNRAIEKSTLAVTPRVSRPIDLGGGAKVEPFLSLKGVVDFGDATSGAGHGTVDTTRGVGGGVTLAQPNAYSLSVTTDIEEATSSDKSNVKGRLELKLPLR